VALDELDETAALARGDLDVGDFSESLEERAELILSHVAGKTTNEDSGVVGVGELVHGLGSAVEAHGGTTHRGVHAGGAGHTAHVGSAHAGALVLGSSGGDAHGAVAAVDTLHLGESTLLVVLIGEADETVATGHAGDGVGHDLGGLARGEAALEEGDKNVFVNLGAEITNEDGVLGATVITAKRKLACMILTNTDDQVLKWGWRANAHLRSARPPPVAQLSLKTRLVLGMGVPFRERALAAAAAEAKSTKQ
jgi:hypothetical protein